MYNAEARARFFYLPMPGTTYYTPWLWIDGDYSAGSSYSNWENLIVERATVASPIMARIWGDYNPTSRTGTIYARFISDSNATLEHRVLFVITEDSIQRSTPNGDLWHNHVARDYIPDHIGTPVTLNYQDSVTVSYPFTISSSWVESRCEIVAMIQDPVNVNITKRISQGAKIKVSDLNQVGIEEENNHLSYNTSLVTVSPNPGNKQTRFIFNIPIGNRYSIKVYDALGRKQKTIQGVATSATEMVSCNSLEPGIYFYQFETEGRHQSGKIIVK